MPGTVPVTLTNNTIADADEVMENFNYLTDLLDGLPDGTLINGRIDVTVAAGVITVKILTDAGATPSAADPAYIKIGGTWRTISAALYVTDNGNNNTFLHTGTELTGKSIDYFTYLFWNSTNSAVGIGFSRLSRAKLASYFTAQNSDKAIAAAYGSDTSIALSSGSNPTFELVNIGRFSATCTTGAPRTWSVPATDIRNYPTYATKAMDWQPVYSASASMTWTTVTTSYAKYWMIDDVFHGICNATGTIGGTPSVALYTTMPFTVISMAGGIVSINGAQASGIGRADATNSLECYIYTGGNWGAGAGRGVRWDLFAGIVA